MLNILGSLCTKRFRGVGEQRKTEERDCWCFACAKTGVRAKRGKRRRGKGKKETLADNPLEFENHPLDLLCLKHQVYGTEKS